MYETSPKTNADRNLHCFEDKFEHMRYAGAAAKQRLFYGNVNTVLTCQEMGRKTGKNMTKNLVRVF